MASSSTPSLAEMLKNYPITLLPNNKILCKVTGHEMPARPEVVHAYLNGKKYQKELSWYSYNFDEFLPYIVPHKENKKLLVCTLTNQTLNRIPDEVKKHMNGKKFLRLKAEHEEKQSKRKQKKNTADAEDSDEENELEIPEDIAGEVGVAKSSSSKKASKRSKKEIVEEEDDDESVDNLSDLMGSDYDEDGSDNEEDLEQVEDDSKDDEEEEEAPKRKKQKSANEKEKKKGDKKALKAAAKSSSSSNSNNKSKKAHGKR